MEGRELRQSVTLSEQLVSVDSSSHHLRDLLKLREEDDLRLSRRRGEGVTLASVIASEKRDSAAADAAAEAGNGVVGRGRTLLDIIREEQEMHGGVVVDGSSPTGNNWRSFRERLRLRRVGTAWTDEAAEPPPAPAVPSSLVFNQEHLVPDPTASEAASIVESASSEATGGGSTEAPAAPTETEAAAAAAADEGEQLQTRVSLMSLLEQTDRQWAGSPSMERGIGEEEEEEERNLGEGGGGEELVYMCCVCMVRHKGAAFIPCGHTFCRLCSRELWVSRGNCPLCNANILEILDIF